jgi:hypothetical protein
MTPDREAGEGLTLAQVSAELDGLAERRLYHHPSPEELARWEELTGLEERLLERRPEAPESQSGRRNPRCGSSAGGR